jgi:DNA (cytosine-5)-methyltransferase 1
VPGPGFTFIDLFAGIGGFHAALAALGGRCVYASEIDPEAKVVYKTNWHHEPDGDITEAANDDRVTVPSHDVLAAGFPCQPFSKSGYQRGMDEARGTLFWNIARVLEERRPSVVLLENVRNIAGPRHRHEWDVIIRTLRDLGYRVSDEPAVFTPHLLPPSRGGRPQVRDRVFIAASYVGEDAAEDELRADPPVRRVGVDGWDPNRWDLARHLPLDAAHAVAAGHDYGLSASERRWIDAWNDFVVTLWEEREGRRLPGFPIWADAWVHIDDLDVPPDTPTWKRDFLIKNAALYTEHQDAIDAWLARWNHLADFPASRRKLEWQAQDTAQLWDTVMHLRPSGIRAKRPSYVPALVAITQTSIVGPRDRRLSPREAARLQGLPEWFDFGAQSDAATYRQLGNGVNVGVAYHVLRSLIARDADVLAKRVPRLVAAAQAAPDTPDMALESLRGTPEFTIVRTRQGHRRVRTRTSAS